MNKYSNILKLSASSDLYMEFMNTLTYNINRLDSTINLPSYPRQHNTSDLLINENNININLNHKKNIIIEPVLSITMNATEKLVSEVTKDDKFVVLTLNILDILPRNISNFSSALCPVTNERYLK